MLSIHKSIIVLVFLLIISCFESFSLNRLCNRKVTTSLNTLHKDADIISPKSKIVGDIVKQSKGIAALFFGLSLSKTAILPAQAFGALEDANQKLSSYDLPPIIFVPPGFSPLVSEYGRGNNKEAMDNPILVQFAHPSLWVVATTAVNNNGESGTISANDYIKGDSSFLFVQKLKDEVLSIDNKALVTKFIMKSLSQKGDPVDTFKMGPLRLGAKGVDNQQYYQCDISYILNTEAGFLIGRKGVVTVTSVGPYIQGLITVATDKRYKTLETNIRAIADSFRVYKLKSGIFSKE